MIIICPGIKCLTGHQGAHTGLHIMAKEQKYISALVVNIDLIQGQIIIEIVVIHIKASIDLELLAITTEAVHSHIDQVFLVDIVQESQQDHIQQVHLVLAQVDAAGNLLIFNV